MDLVSVIIPAYNCERYLRSTLDSALAQTYPACEIIVVDDGSTDSTPQILQEYQGRITYLTQRNAGSGAACNTAVRAARGKWIAFLDSDDLWLPNKIALQMEHLRDMPISHTDSICFGDSLATEIRRSSFEPPYDGMVLPRLLVKNFITKSSVMMLRDVYLECGGFDGRYVAVEDWPFFINVCAKYPLGYLPEPVVRYRVHAKSKSMASRRTLSDHVRIIEDAFAPDGVGAQLRSLRREALARSYRTNAHYAAESGDWSFAIRCALNSLMYGPLQAKTWRILAKSALIPCGRRY